MPNSDLTTNTNFLSPLGFRLVLKKTPNLEYFCQSVTLPTLSMGEVMTQTSPFNTIPRPGDHIQWDQLSLRFRVDEQMKNYLEIYNWIISLGFPDRWSQHQAVKDAGTIKQDGTVIILTSNNNPGIRIFFQDMFPVSLSPLTFDVTQSDVEYLEAEVSFKYTKFELEAV